MEAPKDIQEAVYGEENNPWISLVASEIMYFLKRKVWKKVPHSICKDNDQPITKMSWQFKKKLNQDKSIWHKSRGCAKGYKKMPGKDYTESYSLVVMDY
jgi:hypothetical protein